MQDKVFGLRAYILFTYDIFSILIFKLIQSDNFFKEDNLGSYHWFFKSYGDARFCIRVFLISYPDDEVNNIGLLLS